MAPKAITVLGVNGKQGSSVANHFLTESDWHIRGVTRNSASESSKAWIKKGVEIIEANLDDIDSLSRAFEGSHAIFVVTEYAGLVAKVSQDPDLQSQAAALGLSIEDFAGELEKTNGINAAKAAANPRVLATLERYVWSTLPAVKEPSQGKYTHAPELDAKAALTAYIRSDLPQLAERMSTMTVGNYLENVDFVQALAPQKENDGSYSFLWPDIQGEHTAHPELWVTQDAGAFVKGVVLDHPAGIDALVATAIIDSADYAAAWSRATGLPAQSKVVTEAEYAALVPEDIRETFMDLIKFVTKFGVGDLKTAAELGIKTRSLEDWFKSQAWIL